MNMMTVNMTELAWRLFLIHNPQPDVELINQEMSNEQCGRNPT